MAIELPIQSANSSIETSKQTQAAATKEKADTYALEQKQAVQQKTVEKVERNQEPVQLSKEEVQAAVSKLKEYVESYKRDIQFSVDDDTGRTVVRLLDSENNVLRQIPSEELLDLVKSIEQNKGLLLVDEA